MIFRTAACAVAIALLGSGVAHADEDAPRSGAKLIDGRAIQEGMGIEVGAIWQTGHSEFASNNLGLSPNAQGLILRDRNGVTSRMVIGLLVAIGGALAQSGPKSVESRSYRSGDYVVTETKTTYYSEAEKAEMAEATNKSIDGLFSARYSDFELQLYSRDRFDRGEVSGYKLNMLIGDTFGPLGVETGMGFGSATSLVDDAGTPKRVHYAYFGMPFRASAVAGPLRFALTYEWNWLKYGVEMSERKLGMDADGVAATKTASHPWHLDVSTLLFKRIAVTGGITTQVLREHYLGYYVSAGLFF